MSAHIPEKVKLDLISKDWDYDSVYVNILYDNILENVKDSMDNWAPIKIRKTECKKKWIDQKVRLLQKERDIQYKIFKFTDNPADFHEYKEKRNEVVSLLRTKEKKYYEDDINKCGKDSKKILKEVVSTSREGFSSYER
ncbi:hypothetical protein HHI36_009042 [Cryptolaemus montrouzieri]|uniref:Uncharacterized protein n=1 Tax=Cryptolaemus montrouzieri TaxID=559131 RepID=A0ABD2MU56_9CUCU